MRYTNDARYFPGHTTLHIKRESELRKDSAQLLKNKSPLSLNTFCSYKILSFQAPRKIALGKNCYCTGIISTTYIEWEDYSTSQPFSKFLSGSRTSCYCIVYSSTLCALMIILRYQERCPDKYFSNTRDASRAMLRVITKVQILGITYQKNIVVSQV